jgi:hypothetical protein
MILPAVFVWASYSIGYHAHPGGFLDLVLPGAILLGSDAGRAVSNNLLSGHHIVLVDEVADVSPTEIVPAKVLQACLQPVFFQDLDQRPVEIFCDDWIIICRQERST